MKPSILIFPDFVTLFGKLSTAAVLTQLLYWRDKKNGGEFYKTQEQLADELGLTSGTVRSCISQLKKSGILLIEKKSLPARNYYLVNTEVLRQMWMNRMAGMSESEIKSRQERWSKIAKKRRTTSESTSESTTEHAVITPKTQENHALVIPETSNVKIHNPKPEALGDIINRGRYLPDGT